MSTDAETLCPRNFRLWVAFCVGMICVVIAIIMFDRVSGRNRQGAATTVSQTGTATQTQTSTGAAAQTDLALKTVAHTSDSSGAWLGIEPVDVTKEMASQMGLKISGGVLVSRIVENSPAQKGGLLLGDVIYQFNHRDAGSVKDLQKIMAELAPGDRVKVGLFREGKRESLYVVLGKNPATSDSSGAITVAGATTVPDSQPWGIVLSELTDDLSARYNVPKQEKGVMVTIVAWSSVAQRAGLQQGDLIQQIDKKKIENLGDFFKAVGEAKGTVLLRIYRQGAETLISIPAPSLKGVVTQPDSSAPSGGPPANLGPRSSASGTGSLPTAQGLTVAQEGIGMNRPVYVPGYDQTQSGDPDAKTSTLQKSTGASTTAVEVWL